MSVAIRHGSSWGLAHKDYDDVDDDRTGLPKLGPRAEALRRHRDLQAISGRRSARLVKGAIDEGVGLCELLTIAADVAEEEHAGCMVAVLLRALQSLEPVLPQPMCLDPALVLDMLEKTSATPTVHASPANKQRKAEGGKIASLESVRKHVQRLRAKADCFRDELPVVRAASAPEEVSEARLQGLVSMTQTTSGMYSHLSEGEAMPSTRSFASDDQTSHAMSKETTGTSKASYVIEGYIAELKKMSTLPGRTHGTVVRRVFLTLDDPSTSIVSRLYTGLNMLTILISTASFVMESMPEFQERRPECDELLAAGLRPTVEACKPVPVRLFWNVEAACIGFFTFDYVLRVATVGSGSRSALLAPRYVLSYMRQPLNVVDLVAIAPFWVELALGGEGTLPSALSVLRLLRIFRVFKLGKHHRGLKMFMQVMYLCGQPLFILAFFNLMIIVLFASLIHLAEGQRFSVASRFTEAVFDACSNETIPAPFPSGVFVRTNKMQLKDEPTPFYSIPKCMWWVVVTLTTVGYGDFTPTTHAGKVVGAACFYMGVLFLALPITILGHNFDIVYSAEHGPQPHRYHRRHNKREATSSRIESRKSVRSNNSGMTDMTRSNSKNTVLTNSRMPMSSYSTYSSFNGDLGLLPWFPRCPGLRKKIFVLLEHPSASKLGKFTSSVIMITILTMTMLLVVESIPEYTSVPDECHQQGQLTVENCRPRPGEHFYLVEAVGITIFSVDYLCRMLTVHAATPEECGLKHLQSKGLSPVWITVLYGCQWLNIIDLLAIAPFYGELITGSKGTGDVAMLRVLRLVRLFRVLRVPKLHAGVMMFLRVLKDSLPALSILVFMTLIACVFFASCIVFAEGENYSVDYFQEEYPRGTYIRPTANGHGVEVSPFTSIVYAFWWFFTTATTVGYGDDYPTTTGGRIVGVLCTYCGIILLAMPVTIVGGNFGKHYAEWAADFAPEGDNGKRRPSEEEPGQQASGTTQKASIFSALRGPISKLRMWS